MLLRGPRRLHRGRAEGPGHDRDDARRRQPPAPVSAMPYPVRANRGMAFAQAYGPWGYIGIADAAQYGFTVANPLNWRGNACVVDGPSTTLTGK